MSLLASLLLAATVIHGNTYSVADVAPGIHSVIWKNTGGPAIGNATFIIGERDVILVDPGISRASANVILEEIRKRTKNPVSTTIHTHGHTDHTYGAYVFNETFPNITFIAHPATRRDIVDISVAAMAKDLKEAKETPDTDDHKLVLEVFGEGQYIFPNMLVDDHLVLMRGARRIEILWLGRGNTDGDLVVWLPEEKVAMTGDLALSPIPFAMDSRIVPWVDTLSKLAALGAATYVPGHGEPQKDTLFIADIRSLLNQILAHVREGKAAGKSMEELQKSAKLTLRPESPINKYLAHPGFLEIFTHPAIKNAYEEVK